MSDRNISEVMLCRVNFENDYKNVCWFADPDYQHSHFVSTMVKRFTDFSYVRKDKILKLPCVVDDIFNCNYVMYRNRRYNNKWFYAFITNMEYVNDGLTHVTIETDVMQTWFFDYEVNQSFIEREHVADDTRGIHTTPENLELGEYIVNQEVYDVLMDEHLNDLCYVIGTTVNPESSESGSTYARLPDAGSGLYNGIYSGVRYYRYDTREDIDAALEAFATAGQSDAITGIFMCPKVLAPFATNLGGSTHAVAFSTDPQSYRVTIPFTGVLDGYVPRNNKLLTYPYTYELLSNNQGANAIYHLELFSGSNEAYAPADEATFSVQMCITPGTSIRAVPWNYKKINAYNNEEGLNMGKFPICNWATDMYTNWLTQNSINMATNYITAGAGLVGSVASMFTGIGAIPGAMGVVNSLATIGNAVSEQRKAALVPPQANGNLNSGDITTSSGNNHFTFYEMSIRQEYARIIDAFFDMFGYKVNYVSIPLENHRKYWWYTKTIDANIDGNIPQDDLEKIRSIYDSGVTFWKNPDLMGRYDLENTITV